MRTPEPPPLPDDLEALLRRLRLPHIRRAAPEVLATARAQRWEPAEVLRSLLGEELAGRERSALQTRRKAASFPSGKTFEAWEPKALTPPSARHALTDRVPFDQYMDLAPWPFDKGILTKYQRRGSEPRVISGHCNQVQLSVKLAWFDVAVPGERIWISSQKVPVVPAAPSVHVVDTVCDPAPVKVSVEVGPVAPSLRVQRYVTVPAPGLVIVPLKVNTAGQAPPV